ncbi:iron-sulfur cluster repair protein YtfE [Kangiella shandongensis]|uniref:iron-sulfur cluster repair protein YtfE n=1 Tax=Kangiella shandongensis TaxID=2763258 RepID=UPI001CBEAF3F|nr:iron-sulfur cluster repair protein YtfE [Kangiella shandongensis]
MNLLITPLGQIARDIPGASELLYQQGIDYSCAGKTTLADALDAQALDIAETVNALNYLVKHPAPATPSLSEASNEEIINHILERYHQVHRQQLPELLDLADRVETVHASHPACPKGLTEHLQKMSQEMESHMLKEEQILFPIIQRGMAHMATSPVAVMRMEHDDHSESIKQLQHLANNFEVPADACNTWQTLNQKLKIFKQDLINHIHIENNILFERIDNYLRGA